MIKFSIFVDGSNLFGSLRNLGLQIDDYPAFFNFIFKQSARFWQEYTTMGGEKVPTQLHRVYWYVLGSIDTIKVDDEKFKLAAKKQFDNDKELKRNYLAVAIQNNKLISQEKIDSIAWGLCYNESSQWYIGQKTKLEKMCQFHQSLQSSTDFIDIINCGHWKVDFLNKNLFEKGIDTKLAVDIVTLTNNYDVALIISGDADSIPSVNHAKKLGKHVGTIEFIKGYPPEKRGRQFSSRLKAVSDFVVQIYEMDLIRNRIASIFKK